MTFSILEARRFAADTLSRPPSYPHIVRADPKGLLIARFCLPLDLCPRLNVFAEMPVWKRAQIKKQLLLLMRVQSPDRLPTIVGRAWARLIRFSSVESDSDASWCKLPIDRLTIKHHGLGLITDDKPTALELHTHWEPAPPRAGFVLLDLHRPERTIT